MKGGDEPQRRTPTDGSASAESSLESNELASKGESRNKEKVSLYFKGNHSFLEFLEELSPPSSKA